MTQTSSDQSDTLMNMENFYLGPSKQIGQDMSRSARRWICVGEDHANELLFIATVQMLWALNRERPRDQNGEKGPLDIL